MTPLTPDHPHLLADSDLLEGLDDRLRVLGAVRAELDDLRGVTAPVAASEWSGVAHRAYVEAMTGLRTCLDRAEEALVRAIAHTSAAARGAAHG